MRYRDVAGSVHDLTELAGLSDVPDQLLLVSERTLSILDDLARYDVELRTRYAVALGLDEFEPPAYDTADDAAMRGYVSNLQLELVPMSAQVILTVQDDSGVLLQPFIPGYLANLAATLGGSATSLVDHRFDSVVPAAGEVWRIEFMSCYYVGAGNAVVLQAEAKHSGTYYPLAKQGPAGNGVLYIWPVPVTIGYPDLLTFHVSGGGASETAYLFAYGHYSKRVPV